MTCSVYLVLSVLLVTEAHTRSGGHGVNLASARGGSFKLLRGAERKDEEGSTSIQQSSPLQLLLHDSKVCTPLSYGDLKHLDMYASPIPREKLSALGNGCASETRETSASGASAPFFWIKGGDPWGGIGTNLFFYPINLILWAESQCMTPWIHFTSCFGLCDERMRNSWADYFEPVGCPRSDQIVRGDVSTVEISHKDVWRALQAAPWIAKTWYFGAADDKKSLAFDREWYWTQRCRAAQVVERYFVLKPDVVSRAVSRWREFVPDPSTKVLGMHLRGTDKGGHRHRKVGPSAYLPYARAWLQRFNNARILLATDDAEMAREVFAWPREVAKFVIMPNPISNTSRIIGHGAANARILKKPVQEGKNAAASEALLDVLLLARSDFLLKPESSFSEASIYWNLGLHNRSIMIEDALHQPGSLGDFEHALDSVGSRNLSAHWDVQTWRPSATSLQAKCTALEPLRK